MKIISPHIKYMQNAFSQRWNALGLTIKSSPIYISLALLALFIVIIPIAMGIYTSLKEGYWSGVFIEFHGMIFDIAVFGIVIAAFTKSINRRLEMQRQQEIIDDYKKWNSE